jgi:hypothetical protein
MPEKKEGQKAEKKEKEREIPRFRECYLSFLLKP